MPDRILITRTCVELRLTKANMLYRDGQRLGKVEDRETAELALSGQPRLSPAQFSDGFIPQEDLGHRVAPIKIIDQRRVGCAPHVIWYTAKGGVRRGQVVITA